MSQRSYNPLAPSRLTIYTKALAENYTFLKSLTDADVAGVIKADAYGTGAKQAYKSLHQAGAREFFVATPEEGIALEAHEDSSVYILGGVYKGAEKDFANNGIIPVLNSIEQIERWARTASTLNKKLPALLHIDTAMNRLGLEDSDIEKLSQKPDLLNTLDLRAIMTHFACSDEADHPLNHIQAQRFNRVANNFPGIRHSLCNSSGIFRDKGWHYDLLRPGYALYGGNPTPENNNPMRRVVDWSVQILQIRLGKTGESAGYNPTSRFEKDTVLATVSIGYADGFLRSGSNKACFYWNGQACPIVGRVSMDLIIVDISKVEGMMPQAGDWLEILGPNQSVDQLAQSCGTIGYEVLTSLRHRAERVYE
jgi:alanine racemase